MVEKNKTVTADKWIWMPHPGHFICSSDCRFHLNTRVGKYIISTVGEYFPDRQVRAIHASIHDPEWHAKNNSLLGDAYDHAYMKHFGFTEIGLDRKYETMVFGSKKDTKNACCPYQAVIGNDVDWDSYNEPEDAYKGHMKLCRKWAKK